MSNLPDWVNDKRGIGKQSPEDRIKWLEDRVTRLEELVARQAQQSPYTQPNYPQWNQPTRVALAFAGEHC